MSSSLTVTNRTVHLADADGTIRDWLVSPAWASSCDDLDAFLSEDGEPWGDGRWVLTNGPDVGELKQRLYAAHQLDDAQDLPEVIEGGPVSWAANGQSSSAEWARVHTPADGFVDWSAFCFTPEYRASLAATAVEVDQSEWRTIEVHTTGPFVLWVGGEVVLRGDQVSYMEPLTSSVRVRLPSGVTPLHLATWQVAFRECRHIVRVRVEGLPVRVVIPSPGADEHAGRLAEQVLNRVASTSWALEGPVAAFSAPRGVRFRVRTSDHEDWQLVEADEQGKVRFRVGGVAEEDAFAEGDAASAGASMLSTGESIVQIGLDDPRCPQLRRIRVAVVPPDSREQPHGDPALWRDEVLRFVAGLEDDTPTEAGLAGLLARHELLGDVRVEPSDLASALHRVETRGDCADFEVLSMLLAWHRVPSDAWSVGLRDRVQGAVTGMKYWITQPGLDAMCYFTENHQFVWHVAELLAGETFPDEVFPVDGRTGAEHADEARIRAAGWLDRKLSGGFSEFDSNAYLAIDSYALCMLIELGVDDRLTEASRVLLDKVLFTLACNSWRGTHGAAHGRSYVHTLRSSRFEETSPILRLLAGVGSLNDAVLPVTTLAISRKYAVPAIIRKLAGEPPREWWGTQVYRGKLAFERDLLSRPYRSDLRAWKTPDVMLSSVQDYRAGLPGLQEHIWGATLAREFQIFVTHPANADTGSSARPNAWAGHRVLPRVHQHRNVVVHLQRFTSSDPITRTHLWLPSEQADELVVGGEWIAVRRGDGYVAIATPGGVRPIATGETAQQEWIPAEHGAVWVAVAGRKESDGDFQTWAAGLRSATLDWNPSGADDPGVRFQLGSGPKLDVTFSSALLVDDVPEGFSDGTIDEEQHLQNPATSSAFGDAEIIAEWDGERLQLPVERVRQGLAQIGGDAHGR
uniref:hypothetical protein n=1 Tax=Pseudoclavibacter sp. RFBI5 TaxID=2080578 RepID=UPI0015E2C17D|nr:hypothetical protein [Pseudoclavibacter sp. RFBI5]